MPFLSRKKGQKESRGRIKHGQISFFASPNYLTLRLRQFVARFQMKLAQVLLSPQIKYK